MAEVRDTGSPSERTPPPPPPPPPPKPSHESPQTTPPHATIDIHQGTSTNTAAETAKIAASSLSSGPSPPTPPPLAQQSSQDSSPPPPPPQASSQPTPLETKIDITVLPPPLPSSDQLTLQDHPSKTTELDIPPGTPTHTADDETNHDEIISEFPPAPPHTPSPIGTPSNSRGASSPGKIRLTSDERASLEAFERQGEENRSSAMRLEKQADAAISSLGNMTQVLLGFLGYTTGTSVMAALANKGHYSCRTGLGLTTVAIVCFGFGFGFTLAIAWKKIQHLSWRVSQLVDRDDKLLWDVESFEKELRSNNIVSEPAPEPLPESETEPVTEQAPLILESTYVRRLVALTVRPNHGGIYQYYRNLLNLFIFEAVLVGGIIFLMSTVVFCSNGDGGGKTPDLELRYST